MHAFAFAHSDISRLGPDDIAAIEEDVDEMQIRLKPGGDWHRPMVSSVGIESRRVSACGEESPQVQTGQYFAPFQTIAEIRRASLEGPLCPVCFTPLELSESERHGMIAGRMPRLTRVPDASQGGEPPPPAPDDPGDPDDNS